MLKFREVPWLYLGYMYRHSHSHWATKLKQKNKHNILIKPSNKGFSKAHFFSHVTHSKSHMIQLYYKMKPRKPKNQNKIDKPMNPYNTQCIQLHSLNLQTHSRSHMINFPTWISQKGSIHKHVTHIIGGNEIMKNPCKMHITV